MQKKTKIVATIGPASAAPETISELLRAGANAFRLNFSHGTHKDHQHLADAIREAERQSGLAAALIADVSGPKIRVGELQDGKIVLQNGQDITLTAEPIVGTAQKISVTMPEIIQHATEGEKLLLDDGTKELAVKNKTENELVCAVVAGGELLAHKGINVPDMDLGVAAFTDKDREDLAFALTLGIRFVAVSFVERQEDIAAVRNFLREHHAEHVNIIAKIERKRALDNVDGIIAASDAVMVARGDLGVEIPFDEVPAYQKEIINKANAASKTVIVATQMLESMTDHERPTRAEVTDVYNAVLDGADAVMLSEETAMGKYPVAAVQAMAEIAQQAEKQYAALPLKDDFMIMSDDPEDVLSLNTCMIAERAGACAIIALTASGRTARMMSRHKPHQAIIALSPNADAIESLRISWGVEAYAFPEMPENVEQAIAAAKTFVQKNTLCAAGDPVIITGGIPLTFRGVTNIVSVQRV